MRLLLSWQAVHLCPRPKDALRTTSGTWECKQCTNACQKHLNQTLLQSPQKKQRCAPGSRYVCKGTTTWLVCMHRLHNLMQCYTYMLLSCLVDRYMRHRAGSQQLLHHAALATATRQTAAAAAVAQLQYQAAQQHPAGKQGLGHTYNAQLKCSTGAYNTTETCSCTRRTCQHAGACGQVY